MYITITLLFLIFHNNLELLNLIFDKFNYHAPNSNNQKYKKIQNN